MLATRGVEDRVEGLEGARTTASPSLSTSENPGPGSGLGLVLVQAVARAHGGRAWVEESPLGGARFWVELGGGDG